MAADVFEVAHHHPVLNVIGTYLMAIEYNFLGAAFRSRFYRHRNPPSISLPRGPLLVLTSLNTVLQVIELLITKGHYTIDLAVVVGARILFDSLAGNYEESKRK